MDRAVAWRLASIMNFTWRRVAYPTLWFLVPLLLLLLRLVCWLRICIEGQCGSAVAIVRVCVRVLCAVRVWA